MNNALTASSKFGLLLRSQALRLIIILIAFVLLSALNRVSVGIIFSLEVASIFVSCVLVLFEIRAPK